MMDTVSQVLERLHAAGFVDDLSVEDGALHSAGAQRRYAPEELRVAETVRFEGASNPADEAIVLALATPDGTPVGTCTNAYGPDADADLIGRLIPLADD